MSDAIDQDTITDLKELVDAAIEFNTQYPGMLGFDTSRLEEMKEDLEREIAEW